MTPAERDQFVALYEALGPHHQRLLDLRMTEVLVLASYRALSWRAALAVGGAGVAIGIALGRLL